MLCKKCKTALDESSKDCPYCGAKTNRKKGVMAVASLCVLVAVSAGALLYITRDGEPETEEAPPSVVELEPPSEAVEPKVESVTKAMPTPTPPPHTADADMQEDEVWDLVENVAAALSDYYERNGNTRVILSKNGYLYNYPAKDYYTPKNFAKIESMKQEYLDEQALLLYIRPDDLKEYLDVDGGSELAFFCAYETQNGFAVARREGRLGIVKREDFQKLLALYNDDHGGIYRLENDSDEFAAVVAGVKSFKPAEYDIRYLVADSKYAFVVLSEKNAPELLEEYVLVKDESGGWSVGLGNLAAEFMYQKQINAKYPDFNIGMLPMYNLYYDAKTIRSNISPLIEAMRTQNVIGEEEGRTTFATGTDKYCYMEFENNKKLLAVYTGEEKGWVIHNINNFLHGEIIMGGYEDNPPSFILKQ